MSSLSQPAQRLFEFYQRMQWWALGFSWVLVGVPSLWAIRVDLGRLVRFFTWTGLRVALFYEPNGSIVGLLFCVGMTLYVLFSQSRYELFGLLRSEQHTLEHQAAWIGRLGSRHIVHRWIFGSTLKR